MFRAGNLLGGLQGGLLSFPPPYGDNLDHPAGRSTQGWLDGKLWRTFVISCLPARWRYVVLEDEAIWSLGSALGGPGTKQGLEKLKLI